MIEQKQTVKIGKTSLWAKKSDKNGLFYWLSLEQHLLDTMNVSALLWEHWLSSGQRALIINSLSIKDENIAKNLCKFLGAIHDLGKATPVFQIKSAKYSNSTDLDSQLIDKLEKAGFTNISTLDLSKANATPHALASQILLSKYGVKDDISLIVGSHHGKSIDEKMNANTHLNAYPKNYFQVEDENSSIYKQWETVQENILQWALFQTGFENVASLPAIDFSTQMVLSGLLIMADWIASNEDYFPLINIDDDGQSINQKQRLEKGWLKWFKTFTWNPIDVDDINNFYKQRFYFEPRDIQYQLSQAIKQTSEPSIFILEAPMGIGKTEAALVAGEQLAAKTGRSGIFFGLPTMATSNGIFVRIKNWLDSIIQLSHETKSVQLVHGKAALNDDFTSIAKNIDIDGDGSIIVNQWFSGKKTRILDDFVVGTVDHFLLAALKQKHLALRHLGLSKKVVIIDEVHAYDAYMSQFLYRVINWMGAYGVPVIILSATLPADRRVELIKSYIKGSGKKLDLIEGLDENLKKTTAYPLISYLDGNAVKQFAGKEDLHYENIYINKINDKDLIEVLKNSLSEGGIAGIVVNTVKRAQTLAKELEQHFGEDTVELLHSSFIASHRINKEKKLLESIGKDGNRPDKKIVIGTQVIEQSLDIDFDILFSDLAPMDLLIQRIGRLHRHKDRIRPPKLKEAMCYVLGTSESFEFESGSSVVYGNYLLIRTQYYLPNIIVLPKDISKLVQKVYSKNDDFISELNLELKGKYSEAKSNEEVKLTEKEQSASTFLLAAPHGRTKSLIGLFHNGVNTQSDEQAFAHVRDTSDRIEVIMVKKCEKGYCFIGENKDISSKIEDFEIGKKLATQTISLPNALSKKYNIDTTIDFLEKYNLDRLVRWQSQVWLKGSLGILLDEDNTFNLNGWKIKYSQKYGLEIIETGVAL